MSLGDRYTGMIDHDIVRTLGSVIMVRETRQGSVNHFYVYKKQTQEVVHYSLRVI